MRIVCLLLLLLPTFARAAEPTVATFVDTWHDAARDRDVPVKIYYPKEAGTASPVIVFSHGNGGSRDGYAYLGEHWAANGYASAHVQHAGSDEAIWKDVAPAERRAAMARSAADPRAAVERPRDVSFAIDRLTAVNADGSSPLHGRLDVAKVGVAGHSFGAFTAMAVAGQSIGPAGLSHADPRVTAAVAMSAPAPRRRDAASLAAAYAPVAIPVYHLTGTRDDSPIGDTKAADRRLAFDHAPAGVPAYLLTLAGGDHMVFGGRPRRAGRPNDGANDARHHAIILKTTTAYFDAFLKGDAAAKAWVDGGAFGAEVGADGVLERKGTKAR